MFNSRPTAEAVRAGLGVAGMLESARVAKPFFIDGGFVTPVPLPSHAVKRTNIILATNVIPNLEHCLHLRRQQLTLDCPTRCIVMGALEIMVINEF